MKTIFRCHGEILSLVIFLCQNLIINLPTTYTNKSLQLPVFDKDALDSVIL